jgi:hypothetical protein
MGDNEWMALHGVLGTGTLWDRNNASLRDINTQEEKSRTLVYKSEKGMDHRSW